MSSFGRRLKSLRNKTGKSQEEVSKEIDIKQTRISFLERQEKAPKEDVVRLFAEYYSVPITYFYVEGTPEVDSNTVNYIDSLINEEPKNYSDFDLIMHSLSEVGEDEIENVKRYLSSYLKNK